MTRSIIFDLDGTLIDSLPDLHAAANVMLAGMNRPALPLETVRGFIGNGVPKLVERCLDATGGREGGAYEEGLAAFRAAYAADPATLTRPYPGVPETLAKLREAGFALGVVTNKPAAPAKAILAALSLRAHFGVVIGGDSFPVMKPDPAPLFAAIKALGGGPAIYVGDSETDEATAQNAGAPFWFFSEGYRKKPAAEFKAEFTFAAFDALRARLTP